MNQKSCCAVTLRSGRDVHHCGDDGSGNHHHNGLYG